MIAFVRGSVHAVTATSVVIDVSGIGMEVLPTARCAAGLRVGEVATVPVGLVVREDSWTLYGFADTDERDCFQSLQAAKGVGPRVALNLLGAMTPDQLRRAIADGDTAALTAVAGIGQKGAARLVIDLRDRLGPATAGYVGQAGSPGQSVVGHGWQREVNLALQSLGWTPADAAAAVALVEPEAAPGGEGCRPDGGADVARLLRLALRALDRSGQGA